MRPADLGSQRIAVWGLGREGRAAIGFLRQRHPNLPLVLLDDADDELVVEAPLSKEMKAGFARFGFHESEAEAEPFTGGAVKRRGKRTGS